MQEKTPEFYKEFYEESRIALLQYQNLRKHFNKMVDDVLGVDYYNRGMDVYTCDEFNCESITRKANRTVWQHMFGT